jgi:imidazoleglycerol-phosphate dehydratase
MGKSDSGFFEASRSTKETKVAAAVRINGAGRAEVSTGVPFFDHMLVLFAVHGLFDINVRAEGDTNVDMHHTVEDVGLVLGDAFREALGERAKIRRYGHAVIPMDEALALVAVDLSMRPVLVFNVPFSGPAIGNFDTQLPREFFQAFVSRAGMACHVNVMYGTNDHHMVEAVFKAFGRAMDQAVQNDPRVPGVPSSKGVL